MDPPVPQALHQWKRDFQQGHIAHGWTTQYVRSPPFVRARLFVTGFAWRPEISSEAFGAWDNGWVAIPYWPIVLLSAVLPIASVSHSLRVRGRARRGLCLHCGYDLRAAPPG